MHVYMYLPGPGVIESCEGPGDEIRVGHHHRVVGVRGQTILAQVIHQLKSDRNVPELTYRGQNQLYYISGYYQGLIKEDKIRVLSRAYIKEERACNSKRADRVKFISGRIWMECARMIVHEMLKIELSIFSTL